MKTLDVIHIPYFGYFFDEALQQRVYREYLAKKFEEERARRSIPPNRHQRRRAASLQRKTDR